MLEPKRLSKRLMELVQCSRREAELYIEGGWVKVNGVVVEQPQTKVSDETIIALVREHFDLRPYGISRMLDLLHPIYQETASYGHFGRPADGLHFSWERTDKAAGLKAAV